MNDGTISAIRSLLKTGRYLAQRMLISRAMIIRRAMRHNVVLVQGLHVLGFHVRLPVSSRDEW